MIKLDARGLSCPEPVLMLRTAMKSGAEEIEITVDNAVSRENVTRSGEHAGYTVQSREANGEYILTLKK